MKSDMVNSASFTLILQTLHEASLLFGPCVKSLWPKVMTNDTAAAGVLAMVLF